MNGAAAVVDSKSSPPSRRSVRRIGTSHHFFVCFRKPRNSLTMFSLWRAETACSKALFCFSFIAFPVLSADRFLIASILAEVAQWVGGGRLGRPVACLGQVPLPAQRVAA